MLSGWGKREEHMASKQELDQADSALIVELDRAQRALAEAFLWWDELLSLESKQAASDHRRSGPLQGALPSGRRI
jgi:hypothetical protein